jgi:hypothetical protein
MDFTTIVPKYKVRIDWLAQPYPSDERALALRARAVV